MRFSLYPKLALTGIKKNKTTLRIILYKKIKIVKIILKITKKIFLKKVNICENINITIFDNSKK